MGIIFIKKFNLQKLFWITGPPKINWWVELRLVAGECITRSFQQKEACVQREQNVRLFMTKISGGSGALSRPAYFYLFFLHGTGSGLGFLSSLDQIYDRKVGRK